jgi:hypothetical protein
VMSRVIPDTCLGRWWIVWGWLMGW